MALDWSKQITFSGLKKKASKKPQTLPSKQHMNLAAVDKKEVNVKQLVLVGILIALLIGLFVKFGVIDVFGQSAAKRAELAARESTYSAVMKEVSKYDEIAEEYEQYGFFTSSGDSQDEKITVNINDVLDLVDEYIRPKANVSSLDLYENTLALTLTNISLEDIGTLTKKLESLDQVESVTVLTATSKNESAQVVTALTIALVPIFDN